jgi:hypothetical protein
MFKLDIKIESDLKAAFPALAAVSVSEWPKILQYASNETGFYVLNKFKQQMPHFIDRPTPFTLNSMFVKKATGNSLETTVQWKDFTGSGSIPAGKYLTPEVYGGARKQKRFERALQAAGLLPSGYVAVPTKDAPVDSYGNVPGGYITQILSYLKANPDYTQNRQVQRLKRMSTGSLIKGIGHAVINRGQLAAKEAAAKKRGKKFFAVIRGRDGNPLPSGIYERVNFSLGSGVRRIFAFVPVATYRVTFPFYDIGSEAAISKFPSKLDEAIARAIAKG